MNRFKKFTTSELEEMVASMEDSDRYINESEKRSILLEIHNELISRGLMQYAY